MESIIFFVDISFSVVLTVVVDERCCSVLSVTVASVLDIGLMSSLSEHRYVIGYMLIQS